MMTRTGTRLKELLLMPKPLLKVELLLEDKLAVRATTDLGADACVAPPPPEAAANKLKADVAEKLARNTS